MELQRLQEQLTAIQSERERVAQQGLDTSFIDATIRDMEQQIAELESQQIRVQAQAEKVDSITLAYDYNEILGNPLANETIIENVKQFQLQAYEEHNAEVARINAQWQKRLTDSQNTTEEVAEDRTVYINDNERLKQLVSSIEKTNDDLYEQIDQLKSEKEDAEQTRDNAVRMLEEKNVEYGALLLTHEKTGADLVIAQEQIEALKQELTAKKALTVSGNEKLAELAAKAKESTAAAAQRGIERWNKEYGMDIPVLAVPEILPVNAVLEEEAPAEENSFQEEVATTNDTGLQEDQGNSIMESVVSEESEMNPPKPLDQQLATLYEHHRALRSDFENLKVEVRSISSNLGMNGAA